RKRHDTDATRIGLKRNGSIVLFNLKWHELVFPKHLHEELTGWRVLAYLVRRHLRVIDHSVGADVDKATRVHHLHFIRSLIARFQWLAEMSHAFFRDVLLEHGVRRPVVFGEEQASIRQGTHGANVVSRNVWKIGNVLVARVVDEDFLGSEDVEVVL